MKAIFRPDSIGIDGETVRDVGTGSGEFVVSGMRVYGRYEQPFGGASVEATVELSPREVTAVANIISEAVERHRVTLLAMLSEKEG